MSEAVGNNLTVPVDATIRRQLGRVAVVCGGDSAEREISLLSGEAISEGLLRAGVDAFRLELGASPLEQLRAATLDRAFIALHGPGGEDGRMQALLSFMGIPYTGSDWQSSALAMDKLRSKQLWQGIGLATPDFALLRDDSDWGELYAQLGGQGVMVKPAHEGSSLGMSRADNAEQLANAYREAKRFDATVIAERLVQGAEYTVTVLDGEALPAIRLETDKDFYDFEAKYESADTRYIVPCGLQAAEEEQLKQLAVAAFDSLGCSTWGRVDLMADPGGGFYVLEVNTVPGMTGHSLVPMAARAAGMSFEEFSVRVLLSECDD